MNLLLDTNALLWFLDDDRRLGSKARQEIAQAEEIAVSEISLLEIAIKVSIGKLQPVPEYLDAVRELRFRRISINDAHLQAYALLPLLHRDPFDRLLIAQAQTEKLTLVTSDKAFSNYRVAILAANGR